MYNRWGDVESENRMDGDSKCDIDGETDKERRERGGGQTKQDK